MRNADTSVRVKVVRRDAESRESRESFWRRMTESDRQNQSVAQLEGKFRREFGRDLRRALVEMFDSAIRHSEFVDVERFLMHWGGPSDRYQNLGDAVASWIEARQNEFERSPALRAAREKRVLARQICFSVSQLSYSSLLFDLDFGPVEKVATVFDHDFESFQVFLNAFVPVAFANSTTEDFADLHEYEIEATPHLRRAFAAPPQGSVTDSTAASDVDLPSRKGREKAEWLWKLANGSLLIPVVIGLLVMLYAIRELSQLQKFQQEQMKPILEHHLELLREDRLRLQEMRGAPQSVPSAAPQQSPAATSIQKP